MLEHLQSTNKDLDCEVIHCADDDMLFISRNATVDRLYDLAHMFILAASDAQGKADEVALYDMCKDAVLVRTLLLHKAVAPAAAAPATAPHSFGEIEALQDIFVEARQRRQARMPLHVMVVEDDPLTRRIVANAFKENYALITAATAEEAVVNYLLYAPDIVFLDIGLPDASGFDVLHQIITCDADAYVVMFSANSYLDNVTTAVSSGASGFVAKPFRHEKMRGYIQHSAHHHRKQSA
jgi:CheY-like chemotaxis protein